MTGSAVSCARQRFAGQPSRDAGDLRCVCDVFMCVCVCVCVMCACVCVCMRVCVCVRACV